MSFVRVIASVLPIVALGACSGETELRCSRDTLYLGANSTGTLRIPDDLSVPDETESLRIPGAPPVATASAGTATSCLEESPAFSTEPQP
jgi:uncharacterized lipoprotein